VMLTPHPLLVPRSKIEYSYTSTLPNGLRGLWKGETYQPTLVDKSNLTSNVHCKSRQCCHHAISLLRVLVPLLRPVFCHRSCIDFEANVLRRNVW